MRLVSIWDRDRIWSKIAYIRNQEKSAAPVPGSQPHESVDAVIKKFIQAVRRNVVKNIFVKLNSLLMNFKFLFLHGYSLQNWVYITGRREIVASWVNIISHWNLYNISSIKKFLHYSTVIQNKQIKTSTKCTAPGLPLWVIQWKVKMKHHFN
jgi:hypothetical protein